MRYLTLSLVALFGVVSGCGSSSEAEPSGAGGGRGTPPAVVPGATFADDESCLGIYGMVPLNDSSGSHSFEFQGVLLNADGAACTRTGSASAKCAPDPGERVCSFSWRCGSCDYALSLEPVKSGYAWRFSGFEGAPCYGLTEIPVRNLCSP